MGGPGETSLRFASLLAAALLDSLSAHPAWLFSVVPSLDICDGYSGQNEFFRSLLDSRLQAQRVRGSLTVKVPWFTCSGNPKPETPNQNPSSTGMCQETVGLSGCDIEPVIPTDSRQIVSHLLHPSVPIGSQPDHPVLLIHAKCR
jgi:hypothetical protein